MVVIADTSPLNYLILIETVDVLSKLYQRVLIPDIVLRELQHSDTPRVVADWAERLPSWIEIVHSTELVIDSRLAELDAGESAAIALAEAHRPNSLLLMDDFWGRNEADRRQIPTVGTLGVLRDAAALGYSDLPTAFARLRQTTFRSPPGLMEALLEKRQSR